MIKESIFIILRRHANLHLAQATRASQNCWHLLRLAVEVELLAVAEYFPVRLIIRANERGDTFRHCKLVFARHYLCQSLCTRSNFFISILLRERVTLLDFGARSTDHGIILGVGSRRRHSNVRGRIGDLD